MDHAEGGDAAVPDGAAFMGAGFVGAVLSGTEAALAIPPR